MYLEWLQKKVETTDLTCLLNDDIEDLGVEASAVEHLKAKGPSDRAKERWTKFIEDMRPGDELWRFKSPAESWNGFSGRAGYAIVRKGEILSFYITIRQ